MKKSRVSAPSAAAILAGGVFFTGPASAAIIFSEDFEGVNAFGMSTYAYAQDYTLPNATGGLLYGNGGTGPNGGVGTNTFPLGGPLTAPLGLSAAQIDAGLGQFNFSGQFSTWTMQGDYAELSVIFRDGANAPIGSPVLLGGMAFSAALAAGPNSKYADAREWGTDTRTGSVPNGARSVEFSISCTKVPSGAAIDGYVDNIVLNISPVPEPGSVSLAGLTGLALLRRRRR